MKNIGQAIKLLRQIHNFKASELAKATGLSKSYVSEIENNLKLPNLDKLSAIANVFQIKISEVMLIAEQLDNPRAISDSTNIANFIHHKILAIMNVINEIK